MGEPLLIVAVCLAGGLGAVARFVLDGVVREHVPLAFPLGTALVNLTGSVLLGLATGLSAAHLLPPVVQLTVGAGFLGGYTTFSTASVETVRLVQERRPLAAVGNGLGLLALCTAAAAVGFAGGVAVGR